MHGTTVNPRPQLCGKCVPRCVQVEEALKAAGVADGPIKRRVDLVMVQLKSEGVEMDVLLVRNEAERAAQGVDRARAQRDKLVGPLLGMNKQEICEMARLPLDRSRERGVVEALTEFVEQQHGTANEAVRLFKVRYNIHMGVRHARVRGTCRQGGGACAWWPVAAGRCAGSGGWGCACLCVTRGAQCRRHQNSMHCHVMLRCWLSPEWAHMVPLPGWPSGAGRLATSRLAGLVGLAGWRPAGCPPRAGG